MNVVSVCVFIDLASSGCLYTTYVYCICDQSQLELPHTIHHCQPVRDVGFVGTPVSSVCLRFWASSVYSLVVPFQYTILVNMYMYV